MAASKANLRWCRHHMGHYHRGLA